MFGQNNPRMNNRGGGWGMNRRFGWGMGGGNCGRFGIGWYLRDLFFNSALPDWLKTQFDLSNSRGGTPPSGPGNEKEALKQQTQALEAQLKRIQERLTELEKTKTGPEDI